MKGMLRKLAVLLVAAALFAPTLSRGILQAQEKELVVYSTIFAEYADKMKAEFEKLNPGVKVYIINPGGTEAMISDNAMGIVAGARHPNLAKKFIDFILSDQMQLFGAEYLYIPVKKGLLPASNPASLENASAQIKTLLVPDPSLEEKARADIQAKFGEYIRLK